jgi:hypothetical protein|tara:strand:+ start:1051 stop:1689 length:639 start_codon:yes stop_codon:yes gene_type:complete
MAESPTYTTAEIIALAKGTTNWYEYGKSIAQHLKNNSDDLASLSGGGTPGWNSAIDTRWYVADTSSSTTTYTGVTNPTATGSDSLAAGYSIIFQPATTNTGSSTLNVGTSDGAVTLKKISSGTLQNLSAGDFDSDAFYLLAFDGTYWLQVSGSGGGGGATGASGEELFWENETQVDNDYSISASTNALTAGPITIASGVTVTVPSGCVWVIV